MNISPSQRIGTVEEYYFSSKLKQIAGMRAAGADIINVHNVCLLDISLIL